MDSFVSYSVIGLLVIIVGILGAIGVRSTRPAMILLDPQIEEKIKQLGKIVQDHMDIQAIVALVAELEQQPDISTKLVSYGEEKANAVLMYELNRLAGTINRLNDGIANEQQSIVNAIDPAVRAARVQPNIIALEAERDKAQDRYDEIMEILQDRAAA